MVATPGQGPDRPQEVSYTDTKVIGNGSFGVVYQAKLCDSGELVAIKKVLQDKRFKVRREVTAAAAARGSARASQFRRCAQEVCRCEASEPAQQLFAFSRNSESAGVGEPVAGGPQWGPGGSQTVTMNRCSVSSSSSCFVDTLYRKETLQEARNGAEIKIIIGSPAERIQLGR